MYESVTKRIESIKQPYGGYIKISDFEKTVLDDGRVLNDGENVSASVVGTVVDYLTRFIYTGNANDSFKIPMLGAKKAEDNGYHNAPIIAYSYFKEIHHSLDRKTIINACKLVYEFDVWYRSTLAGISVASKGIVVEPDNKTIENIAAMVNRGLEFFDLYGPIIQDGFTFEPPNSTREDYINALKKGKTYGGYTPTVATGDGDFLTSDTLWDFKVLKKAPQSKHTLQILVYWIMGQHSGQAIFKSISKIGIYNPRSNTVYRLSVSEVPSVIIKSIENEVICYT